MPAQGFMARHARSILAVLLALALAGVFAATQLPNGLFPVVQFPRVVVDVNAGARPADQTELLVTIPLERAVRRVLGVVNLRSTTSRGSAQLSIDFGWGADMVSAAVQVDAAMAQALPSLPPGTSYQVRRMDPTVYPVIAYSMLSKAVGAVTLRDIAQYQLVPLLTAIPGVSYVGVQGGQQREVEVLVDPHRLAMHGLALADVASMLGKANVLTVVGRMQDHDKLLLLALDDTMRQMAQVRDTVVQAGASGIVRVGDLAEVQDGVVPQWTRVGENGSPAVQLAIYQQPTANNVAIAAGVRVPGLSIATAQLMEDLIGDLTSGPAARGSEAVRQRPGAACPSGKEACRSDGEGARPGCRARWHRDRWRRAEHPH